MLKTTNRQSLPLTQKSTSNYSEPGAPFFKHPEKVSKPTTLIYKHREMHLQLPTTIKTTQNYKCSI